MLCKLCKWKEWMHFRGSCSKTIKAQISRLEGFIYTVWQPVSRPETKWRNAAGGGGGTQTKCYPISFLCHHSPLKGCRPTGDVLLSKGVTLSQYLLSVPSLECSDLPWYGHTSHHMEALTSLECWTHLQHHHQTLVSHSSVASTLWLGYFIITSPTHL